MGEPNAKTPSIFQDLRRWLDNVLGWSLADKCLVAALIVFPLGTSYVFWEYYFLRHPEIVSFIDLEHARKFFLLHAALLEGVWLAIIAAALWLRRRSPNNRALVHVVCQAYCIGFALISYELGHFTTGYMAAVLLGGAAVGFLLFDPKPVLLAITSGLLVILATTVAEQAGLIPYGPLVSHAPFENGRLSGWWLASVGGLNLLVLAVVLTLIHYIFDRWRDHERRLAKTATQLARASEAISRYTAAQVAEHILAGNYEIVDRRDRRKLTIFFSDIKGFTGIADRMDPEDVSRMLNEYLSEMTGIAERYGGTIDKFIGDAIMIFFGAPSATNDRDHALRAVRMAIEMQERMNVLRPKWIQEAIEEPFEIRVGINTGHATVGNFGSKGRLDYTAIGKQVNLAARLQASCEPGRILLSYATWVLVQDEIPCAPQGEIQVKGIHHPVKIYGVELPEERRPAPAAAPAAGGARVLKDIAG
jgi:class 3 adenylate cyclase